MTNQTVNFIKQFEGLKLEPYPDNTQWSIGYGTFAGPYPGPKPALRLPNEKAAHDLMFADLTKREQEIRAKLKKDLNPNQFSALLSFAYNAGVGAASKVIEIINQGNLSGAAEKMLQYVYSGGKKLDSLIKRRASEIAMFNAPFELSKVAANDSTKKMILTALVVVAITVLLFKWTL